MAPLFSSYGWTDGTSLVIKALYSVHGTEREKLGLAGYLAILAMLTLLTVSVFYAVQVWSSMEVAMSAWGWVFLGLGVTVSIGLGAGLMALVFYSSRHDYDR